MGETAVHITPTDGQAINLISGEFDDIVRIATPLTSASTGAGNDTILYDPQASANASLDGGSGDDVIRIGRVAAQYTTSGYSTSTDLPTPSPDLLYDLTATSFQNIEVLDLAGSAVNLSGDQIENFSSITGHGTLAIPEGGDIHFERLSEQVNLALNPEQTYTFIGSDEIDTLKANNGISDFTTHSFTDVEILDVSNANIQLTAEQFNNFSSIIGSGSVQLTTGGTVYSDRNQGSFDLRLAEAPTNLIGTDADDTIRLDVAKISDISVDGTEGHDTLELTGTAIAKLDDLSLTSIETIKLDGASLLLSSDQLANATITGHGALHLSDGASIALEQIQEAATLLGDQGAQAIADIFSATADLTGAAITGNAATPTQGTWQFSTTGGRSWRNIPTNLNVDGSSGLLLQANSLIRFSPAPDFNGTPGALNLRPLTTP